MEKKSIEQKEKQNKVIIDGREYKKGPGIQMMEATQESLKGRTAADIPHPPPIKTVIQTVTDISDVPGQMKVDKSGKLLGKFLYFDGLTYPIIDCYDNWLHNRLHQQILSSRPFMFAHGSVRFTDITITPPTEKSGSNETYNVYPRDCRTNSLTYSASVYAKFEYTPNDSTKDKIKSTPFLIGKIPLMLGSQLCHLTKLTEKELIAAGECNHDPFGYFIIKGVDEIIILKERLRCNVPLIFVNDDNKSEIDKSKGTKREISTICQFTAFTLMGTTITNIVYDTNSKSLQLELGLFGKSPNTLISPFSTKLFGFNALLPFKLFGVSDNNKIKEMILRFVKKGENKVQVAGFLQSTINSLNKLVELEELARIIPIWKDMYGPKGKNIKATEQEKLDFGVQEIEDNLFKQMSGVPNVRMAKLELLAIMIARYSEQRLNLRHTDDRDNWANKRIISAGLAMEQLFNKVWQKLVIRGMEKSIEEQKQTLNDKSSFVLSDLVSIFEKHGNSITNTFVTSFTPDQWGIKGDKLKGNMTDYLKNDTLLSKYSQILRVKAEMNENNNQILPRLLHMSQCGLICPGATPEGKQCGIVKECAVGMYTSIYRNDQPLLQLVKKYLSVTYVAETHYAAFMLNGKFYGWCDGIGLRDKIRGYRRALKIDRDTALRFEEPAILWVFTDGGRPTQPLLIVDKDKQKLKIQEDDMWDSDFKTLLEKGYIEYLDPFETEETYKSDFLLAKSVDELAFGVETNYQLITSYKVTQPSTGPSQTASFSQRDLQRPYTHCLMDPSAVLSVLASIIPFANRNQAPRITLQCLPPSTLVYLPNGDLKEIGNLKVGDEVLTVDPETKKVSVTKVKNWFNIRNDGRKVFEIETISGRKIIATEDHPLITSGGRKKISELEPSRDKLCLVKSINDLSPLDEEIKTIKETSSEWICDIETESENHTFICADGFVSGNCSMGKQALGISHTNLRNRTDLLVQSLAYPTTPAVMTQIYPEIGLSDLPAGQMVTVAYCPFYGYNQEDAIVVSKSAVERGLFRSFRTITIKVYESRGSTKEPGEQIEAPSQELINKNRGLYDYSMLDANGIIKVNSPVVPKTCIVSKVKIRKGPNGTEEKIDASEYLKLGDTGIVENVFISELGGTEIKKIVIIKIREMRIPQSGDKLASRYAQKGTIGKVVPTVDLPFIYGTGSTPDLFLNMHAIPSRMTMGKILEILASSSSVLAGKRINSTAFRPLNTNDFRDVLKAYGFNPNGYSMMVNGITGELMQTPIFTGPCYFQVLRHQVRDKYQGRATGPKNNKTRQPIGKKKNSGAIKLEEMAEQAIGSHGAASVLKNKFEHSDLYKTIICNKCEYFTNFNIQAIDQSCKRCKTKDYRIVTLPYILKYKMQLLAANGIMVKLKTKELNKDNTNFLIPPAIDYSKAPSSSKPSLKPSLKPSSTEIFPTSAELEAELLETPSSKK